MTHLVMLIPKMCLTQSNLFCHPKLICSGAGPLLGTKRCKLHKRKSLIRPLCLENNQSKLHLHTFTLGRELYYAVSLTKCFVDNLLLFFLTISSLVNINRHSMMLYSITLIILLSFTKIYETCTYILLQIVYTNFNWPSTFKSTSPNSVGLKQQRPQAINKSWEFNLSRLP